MQELEIVRKINVKSLLMAVAMTAVLMNSAYAAEPRSTVTIDGDTVTVGDVFSGVTHDASYVLAPAPASGKVLTLNVADLQRISDAFNLGWEPSSAVQFPQVTIKRDTREITTEAIEGVLQDKITETMKGRKFGLQLTERNLKFFVPESQHAELGVNGLKVDLSHNEFHAQVVVPAGAEHPAVKQEVSGHIYSVTSVPVLKNAVNQGDVITSADIDYVDMRDGDIGGNIVVDPSKLIGMAARHGISPLKTVATSDIVAPFAVKKGEMVTMVLENEAMTLTAQGRALENGAVGEAVKIVNTASNQTVQAVVTGLRAVAVASPNAEAGL